MGDVLTPTQIIIKNITSTSTSTITMSTALSTNPPTLNIYEAYEEFEYQDGQEIPQTWNPVFVVFAYFLACVSAYSAVHLLDHSMWRATAMKERAEIATSIHHPDVWAACLLAFGSVWCMHFVGMAAVTLEKVPICYNWGQTLGSLAVVLVLMIAGIKVAGNDIFATSKRGKILKEIIGNKYMSDTEAMWAITRIVTLHKLHWLFFGSVLAALGALVMHYTGMMAQRGPFTKQWRTGYVAASVISGVLICFVGFWIIFRLRWKVKQFWLRYLSAAVIAAATCFLHFFGMLGATYYADYTKLDTCQGTWEASNSSPSAWNVHQMVVCGISILLPSIALYIENLISKELILTFDVTESASAMNAMNSRFADDKSKLKNFLSSNASKQKSDNASIFDDSDQDLDDPHNLNAIIQSKPIADLFPHTSILVANITGFTAWSSMREPQQVFMLLETIYQAFNKVVKTYKVHKIESTGDQYVVVAGLPEPRKDHATVLCKVARECVTKIRTLTQKLEVLLGPDTGDLNIRIGIHSGPVTAGVLRGERATFQLFGDTMNVANRLESTGMAGKVHVSADTAELLKQAGKAKWLKPREDQVFVKGKGLVQTHWLRNIGIAANPDEEPTNFSQSVSTSAAAAGDEYYRLNKEKTDRLIHWNVETLVRILKEIVARRNATQDSFRPQKRKSGNAVDRSRHNTGSSLVLKDDATVIDEVCEIIDLPEFDFEKAKQQKDPESIVIPEKVVNQLKDYITCLAELYHSNPFHNFEHASHVAMSVTKLLSRIVAHSSEMIQDAKKSVGEVLHENTFGITSDPLTQFACILAALMHDADHQGVPNGQLVKEGTEIAQIYKNKSVAEQNSVDLAWEHLMDDKYQDLRETIYASEEEMKRFRQLIVNSIMATDIMDKDLKQLRNARWDKAFSEQDVKEDPNKTKNRKATIVIEHLIQASDVAHTMQHWHVYRKWNQCLFEEMYKAYKEGRAEKDPSEFWYKGEIGFFDFYIIPLAKKLKECGVFGVSSDEYLNYALQNRKEWEATGEQAVAEMIEAVKKVWADIEAATDGGVGVNGDDDDKGMESGNTAEGDTDLSDFLDESQGLHDVKGSK